MSHLRGGLDNCHAKGIVGCWVHVEAGLAIDPGKLLGPHEVLQDDTVGDGGPQACLKLLRWVASQGPKHVITLFASKSGSAMPSHTSGAHLSILVLG